MIPFFFYFLFRLYAHADDFSSQSNCGKFYYRLGMFDRFDSSEDQQVRDGLFHIFHSWRGEFVNLVLVLVCPYELIVCKQYIEHDCSQRILCPHKSVWVTDFSSVLFFPIGPSISWIIFGKFFKVLKYLLWFWCLLGRPQ